jgi:hypothetical protein
MQNRRLDQGNVAFFGELASKRRACVTVPKNREKKGIKPPRSDGVPLECALSAADEIGCTLGPERMGSRFIYSVFPTTGASILRSGTSLRPPTPSHRFRLLETRPAFLFSPSRRGPWRPNWSDGCSRATRSC